MGSSLLWVSKSSRQVVNTVDLKIRFPTPFDPFAEAGKSDACIRVRVQQRIEKKSEDYVRVRGRQRDEKKSLATVQLPKKEISYEKIKDPKKQFCGKIIQPQVAGVAKEYVHISIQQRSGKKSLTTVQGLKQQLSYEKILRGLKEEFCCKGNVLQDKKLGKVIQLEGDQRKNASQFLVQAGHVRKDQIKIHGF